MDKDITTQVLWDHEREEILAALGVEEIDPRAWSTEALIEKIKESIEGRDRPGNVLVDFALGDGALHGFDVTLDEIEDWLDDVPLFDASTLYHKESGKRQNEVHKLQGATQSLWDYERRQILRVLGIRDDNVNLRPWSTENLVNEIKDCIEGQMLLSGEAQWLAGMRVDRIVELAPNDPELLRAWKSFPDPVTDDSRYKWEYLATELIEQHWVHIFVNRRTSARVPARVGWAP